MALQGLKASVRRLFGLWASLHYDLLADIYFATLPGARQVRAAGRKKTLALAELVKALGGKAA